MLVGMQKIIQQQHDSGDSSAAILVAGGTIYS